MSCQKEDLVLANVLDTNRDRILQASELMRFVDRAFDHVADATIARGERFSNHELESFSPEALRTRLDRFITSYRPLFRSVETPTDQQIHTASIATLLRASEANAAADRNSLLDRIMAASRLVASEISGGTQVTIESATLDMRRLLGLPGQDPCEAQRAR